MIASFFARYRLTLEILATLALVGAAAYGVHTFIEHQRDIGRREVQAQWDAQKAADKRAAEKLESAWRAKYDTALNQGAEHAKAMRVSAAAANAAADSLRNTTDDLSKLLPTATAKAARAYASAYQTVFAECVGRYKAMGEEAQGHANDSLTLQQAWPTNAQPSK